MNEIKFLSKTNGKPENVPKKRKGKRQESVEERPLMPKEIDFNKAKLPPIKRDIDWTKFLKGLDDEVRCQVFFTLSALKVT